MTTNSAAWLTAKGAPLQVRPAPVEEPGPDEIRVRARAVAANPLEWIIQVAGNLAYPWIRHPFVIGSDVAGEVAAVGSAVTRFRLGDRVIGHAVGTDKDSNSSARGAFQEQVIVSERLAAPIPDDMPFTDAVVIPLGLSTAATALFADDQLGLRRPSASPVPSGSTVVIWGGSTSVGSNAIQLAVAAGYDVVATASPRNHEHLRALGARAVFDRRSPTVVTDLRRALEGRTVAGAVAIGTGAASRCVAVLRGLPGNRFVANATPGASFHTLGDPHGPLEFPRILAGMAWSTAAFRAQLATTGVRSRFIWGSALKKDDLSTAIYADFLPRALADGRFVPSPPALVIGHGLDRIQDALDIQRRGVSAQKVVVTV